MVKLGTNLPKTLQRASKSGDLVVVAGFCNSWTVSFVLATTCNLPIVTTCPGWSMASEKK